MSGALGYSSASVSGCGGGGEGAGGPAPFLVKTYEMVDDSSTDQIVSWSSTNNSFIVWNHAEFSRLLLPTYFKHNNFSSFIRQLNTYGFRKIDPERWEFLNDDFVKDQKHLLKNIHRRKPIHSHSHPPSASSSVDQERAMLQEQMDKLLREKAAIEAKLLKFKQQKYTAKHQLDEMAEHVEDMERRQKKLLDFLETAIRNPNFIKNFGRKVEELDVLAYNKKRRLPQVEQSKPPSEDSHLDNSSGSSRPESGNIFDQSFSNKLRLELSPAVSGMNMVSHSIQSSNEEGASPKGIPSGGDPKATQARREGLPFAPEALELADTGSCPRRLLLSDNTRTETLQQRLTSSEETDGSFSCHLNLTLASAPLPDKTVSQIAKTTHKSQEIGRCTELNFNSIETSASEKNQGQQEEAAVGDKQANAAPPARVNDVFWEHFLTERPGSLDNEEASSTYRGNPYEEQEEKRNGNMMSRNTKNIEQLTL